MNKASTEVKEKKTVAEIMIQQFLKDVDEKGTMPWQRPYERYNAFNYFTMNTYRGINRLILPFGEYMTERQINTYNKEHHEDFRFQKGIEWFPVCFFTQDVRQVDEGIVKELFPDKSINKDKYTYIGYAEFWHYFYDNGKYFKQRNVLKYYRVAERKHFKNSKGEYLPSRLETGEVEITLSNPQEVFDNYVERSGIILSETNDVPCYIPAIDTVELNKHTSSEEAWFSTAFHEFAHSTGARNRLNRVGVTKNGVSPEEKKNVYAVEECIAEITASLCCSETGITNFETSQTQEYENSIAYVQAWKARIKDFGKEFVYICSQADKAFNYIMDAEM